MRNVRTLAYALPLNGSLGQLSRVPVVDTNPLGRESMQYIRAARAPIALLALSAVVACAGGDNDADSALATDTAALNRDINLAGADTSAQPALTDVPAQPATSPTPAASRPTTSGSRPS